MPFTTKLLGDGVLLRPFENTDAAEFARAVRESASGMSRWMPWCHAGYTEEEALAWFDLCRESLHQASAFEFGVFSGDGQRFLGGAGLNLFNRQHGLCNLGYWVRQSRQGLGVATACARLLSRHAFAEHALHRVEIVVAVGNDASAAVAVKAGAMLECVARNRLLLRGEPVAAQVFSLVPGH